MVIHECCNALQLNPKYVKALLRRSRAFLAKGLLVRAVEDLSTVSTLQLQRNPSNRSSDDSMIDRFIQLLGKIKANIKLFYF